MYFLKRITYDESNPFNGIIQYLKNYTKHEDIHSNNDIHIFVSSNYSSYNDIRTPIGYNNSNHSIWWTTDNLQNSWYAIDFRSFLLKIDSYLYYTHPAEKNIFNTWYLQGSNDGYVWNNITEQYRGEQENIESKHLLANKNNYNKYNMIRLYTEGTRQDGSYHLAIHGIEFYGSVYSKYSFAGIISNNIYSIQLSLGFTILIFCILL